MSGGDSWSEDPGEACLCLCLLQGAVASAVLQSATRCRASAEACTRCLLPAVVVQCTSHQVVQPSPVIIIIIVVVDVIIIIIIFLIIIFIIMVKKMAVQ